MSFLQQPLLWALPLALFPVALHFLNRMRHRSVPWGAMMFLLSATRSSTRNAKLRQFLILACRVLAIAALVCALARPLAGGWWGASQPDAIVLLLDRSASMETKVGEETRRQIALRRLAEAARRYEGRSRIVLLDSASDAPQEVGSLDVLDQLDSTAATDTAADMPALLKTAVEWLADSKSGASEIWIASDLQTSNWQPAAERWSTLAAQMTSLPLGVRVRVLALPETTGGNAGVEVVAASRRYRDGKGSLELSIAVESSEGESVPVGVTVDETRLRLETPKGGERAVLWHTVDLGERKGGGWGFAEIPADANARDNRAFFTYPPEVAATAAIKAEDDSLGRLLAIAAAPAPERMNRRAVGGLGAVPWDGIALVVWQGALPEEPLAGRLREFANGGGTVLFLPPTGGTGGPAFEGMAWSAMIDAANGTPDRVMQWKRDGGPVADSREGIALPLDELAIRRTREIVGVESGIVAGLEDGKPLLVQRDIGLGQVLFLATLPMPEWSSLAEGPVLVPLLQRLFEAGAARLSPYRTVAAGEWIPDDPNAWTAIDSDERKNPRTQAGIYRSGTELVAVSRPAREDSPESLGRDRVAGLFGEVPIRFFGDESGPFQVPQGELWPLFVGLVLLFLLVEGWLGLPDRPRAEPRVSFANQRASNAA